MGRYMKNKLWKKGLVLAAISLFIGVGIHPAFAIETKSHLFNNQGEKDCNCQVDNNLLHIKLNRMLIKLEIYSKILSVSFKYNPEVVEECEEILDVVNLNRLSRFPFICKFLEFLSVRLIKIEDLLMYLIDVFWDNPKICNKLISFYFRLFDLFGYVNHLYFIFECW